MTEFNRAFIDKVSAHIEQSVVDRMDKISIHAHNRLTVRTDVDTGQARAGWNFVLNRIDKSVPKRPAKGAPVLEPQPSVPDQYAQKMSDVYHLVNAVPHIIYLNEGISNAPTNFIEQEVAFAVNDVERGRA